MGYGFRLCTSILLLITAISAFSCSRSDKTEEGEDIFTYDYFIEKCNYYCEQGISDSMLLVSSAVYANPQVKDDHFRLVAALYAAQSAMETGKYELAGYYLREIDAMDHSETPAYLMGMWKGIQSTYEIQSGMNFSAALSYLFESLAYSRQENDWLNICTALCNIGYIYYIRQDTTGLGYAEEAYRISQKHDDYLYLQAISLSTLADLYLIKGDIRSAEEAAQKSLDICSANKYDALYPALYRILGDISFTIGDLRKAESLYIQGMNNVGHSDSDSKLAIAASYGKMLLSDNRYQEAETLLAESLKTADKTGNIKYGYRILEVMSSLYEAKGDISNAFRYYKRFYAARDSVINVNKEKEFNHLLLKYEKASYENTIRRKETAAAIAISALAIISIAGVMSFLLYRRKDRLYRELVEKHRQYAQSRELMRQYGSCLTDRQTEGVENDEALFRKLESLMNDEHLYRDNELSLEKVASLLGTNKSYVSRIINRYTEKTFYGYINTYRIEEATKILGDPSDTTQLKVLYEQIGYNSLQAFYRVFQKEVGCPPSKYREQIKKIDRTGKMS